MNAKKLVDGYAIKGSKEHLLNDAGCGIREYRKSVGMTQTQLGIRTGMDKTHVSKIENSSNLTVATIQKMYAAMGASVYLGVDASADVEPDIYILDLVGTVFEFASRYGLSYKQAFNYLDRFGGIDFYLSDPLLEMSLPQSDTIDSMVTLCRRNGGRI